MWVREPLKDGAVLILSALEFFKHIDKIYLVKGRMTKTELLDQGPAFHAQLGIACSRGACHKQKLN
jgi:hypothetical protein